MKFRFKVTLHYHDQWEKTKHTVFNPLDKQKDIFKGGVVQGIGTHEIFNVLHATEFDLFYHVKIFLKY